MARDAREHAMAFQFRDRRSAGRILAENLRHYAGQPGLVVLGLPRGGVPVAFEVASLLRAPLDVFIVRKLGVPGYEGLAMGAIASGGVRALSHSVINPLRIAAEVIAAVAQRELSELERRETLYREHRPPLDLRGRTVILIDDGLATGATMRAAVAAVRQHQAARVVVAVPVAALEPYAEFTAEVD